MKFYYVKLLKRLLKNKNLKEAERLLRLIEILNTLPYIRSLLYSKEYRGFRYEQSLSYNIENFYMRIYVFRETFYLFLNAIFKLGVDEGDTKFRSNITDIIKSNKKLTFLSGALDKLKKDNIIKECLKNWRAIEHQAVKGCDYTGQIAIVENLSHKKLSELEKNKIIINILKKVDNDIEKIYTFLTNFLERYCKDIFLMMESKENEK